MKVRLLVPAHTLYETYVLVPKGVDVENYISENLHDLADEMEENAVMYNRGSLELMDWSLLED